MKTAFHMAAQPHTCLPPPSACQRRPAPAPAPPRTRAAGAGRIESPGFHCRGTGPGRRGTFQSCRGRRPSAAIRGRRSRAGTGGRLGSPWGGSRTDNPTIGDIHQWSVWLDTQKPYKLWDKLTGRFVSEFGVLDYPSFPSVPRFLTDHAQRHPQSAVMESHNNYTRAVKTKKYRP